MQAMAAESPAMPVNRLLFQEKTLKTVCFESLIFKTGS